jgi:galactose oxidase-like protein
MAGERQPGRPRRAIGTALGMGLLAAGLMVGGSVVLGTEKPPVWAASEHLGYGIGHVTHRGTAADVRRDRRLWAACARPGYRASHAARCPSAAAFPSTAQRARIKRAQELAPASQIGQWSAPFKVPSVAINAVLLPTGKVLWFAYPADGGDTSEAYLWDPDTGATKRVDPPLGPKGVPYNIFCAGQALLPDGELLVAGGTLAYDLEGPTPTDRGLNAVFTFNPWTETWTQQPSMRHGRWYPTVTTLPDGRAVIISGLDEQGTNTINPDVEVFTPAAQPGGVGTLRYVGPREPVANLYPHMVVLPDTTAAGQGGDKVLMYGPGAYDTAILDTSTWTWQEVPRLPSDRLWASGVLMPGGPSGSTKVMLIGGAVPPATGMATTITLDLDNVAAGWQPGPPMAAGRAHHNTVLLADESLLTVGGGAGEVDDSLYAGPVFSAERLVPGTSGWQSAGSQAEARTYHSTAVLLPDGRVVSAGDTRPEHMNGGATAELYSPPYLFSGPRPSITWAPSAVGYGAPFGITTPDASTVAKALLIAPGADTHANDMGQRIIELASAPAGGGLTLTSPADASIAPPGYYMLVLLNDRGVPSTASWIRLGADATASAPPPAPAPSAPPAATPAPVAPTPAPAAPKAPSTSAPTGGNEHPVAAPGTRRTTLRLTLPRRGHAALRARAGEVTIVVRNRGVARTLRLTGRTLRVPVRGRLVRPGTTGSLHALLGRGTYTLLASARGKGVPIRVTVSVR